MAYILVHDLGTSGNKATLFDTDGRIVKSQVATYETFYKSGNQVEQNPEDWWKSVVESTQKLLEGIEIEEIQAISFSGQMQGLVCLDQEGGLLCNSMIWMDQRALAQTQTLIDRLGADRVYEITGHRPSGVYSLEKLMWLKDQAPDIYSKVHKVLNTKDYIIYKLTGKYVTDYSDASGTNALNLKERSWSTEVIDAAGVAIEMFPDLVESTAIVGGVHASAAKACHLLEGTPVVCGGGDGACATLGAACVEDGDAYACMGTSAWVAMTSSAPVMDENKTVFNFAHMIPGKYIPCGAMSSSGTAYQWGLETFAKVEGIKAIEEKISIHSLVEEEMVKSPVGSKRLIFLPYLHGERSPRWNPDAKGVYFGLSGDHGTGDLMRSILEGIAYNLCVILDVFKDKHTIDEINLIGGGVNHLQYQILSDVFNTSVRTVDHSRFATAIGAAVAAGVGIGIYKDFKEVDKFISMKETYEPIEENVKTYNELKHIFDKVYFGLEDVFKAL